MTCKYQKRFTMEDFFQIYDMLDSIKIVKEIAQATGFSRVVINVRLNEMASAGVIIELWRDFEGKHVIRAGNFSRSELENRLSRFLSNKKKDADNEKDFIPGSDNHRRVVFDGELAIKHHRQMRDLAKERIKKVYIGSTFNMV